MREKPDPGENVLDGIYSPDSQAKEELLDKFRYLGLDGANPKPDYNLDQP